MIMRISFRLERSTSLLGSSHLGYSAWLVSYHSRVMVDMYPRAWAPGPRDPKSFIQKHSVHVFKTSSCSLWIEEPGDRHEACVEYSPNDIQPIAKALKSLRGDVDNDEVREPMGGCPESDTFVTRAKGHDLRSIHPRDRQDSEGKDVEEKKGEGYEGPLRLWRMRLSAMDYRCGGSDGKSGGLTAVVFKASITEIMAMQKQQAAALDINILRRPKRSMKKYGLELS